MSRREQPRPGATLWQEQAACAGMTAVFYSYEPVDRQRARATCQRCPVLAECREWGIGNVTKADMEANVIIGGVSARTLKKWRARRRVAERVEREAVAS